MASVNSKCDERKKISGAMAACIMFYKIEINLY
jgi:hypothetical protein